MDNISKITKTFDLKTILSNSKDNNKDKGLKEVAEEFESLFINEMLKRATSAKLAKTILTSDAEETYTSILNQERAKILAKKHNFGIAEALMKQFSTKNSINKNLINKNIE